MLSLKPLRHWLVMSALFCAGAATAAVDDGVTVNPPLTNFITRQGDKLLDGTKQFRFISINVPGLTVIEDPDWRGAPQWKRISEFEQRDIFQTLVQLGATATRPYTFWIKGSAINKSGLAHYNGPGLYDEALYQDFDRTLKLANEYGVRLVVPFIDEWSWNGGIKEFSLLNGGGNFYTDPRVKQAFKDWISFMLNRTNTLTGVKYKDDKAILAWETGNELQAAPEAWTDEIARFIKTIDTNHLVMDGFSYPVTASINSPVVDITSSHFYVKDFPDFATQARIEANKNRGKKAFCIGEAGISDLNNITRLLDAVVADPAISCVLLWSLRPHAEAGGFYWHSDYDQWSYHWPGFDSNAVSNEKQVMTALRNRAYQIRGIPEPARERPANIPELFRAGAGFAWKGSVGAEYYNIDRALSQEGPWLTVGGRVSDADQPFKPWVDTSAQLGANYLYRIQAVNGSGVTPSWAIPAIPNVALNKVAVASSTEAVGFEASKAVDGNSTTRWASSYVDANWISVDLGGVFNLAAVKLSWEAAFGKSYQIQTSLDNTQWTNVYSTTTGTGGVQFLTLAGTARYVRVNLTQRGTAWGYSLWDFEVYGTPTTVTSSSVASSVPGSSTASSVPASSTATSSIPQSSAPLSVASSSAASSTPIVSVVRGKTAVASTIDLVGNEAAKAFDANVTTRWSSSYADANWIYVDLLTPHFVSEVRLNWEVAYGKAYQIQLSDDGLNWRTLFSTATGDGGLDTVRVGAVGRFVRMNGQLRATQWGYSLWEFDVLGYACSTNCGGGSSSAATSSVGSSSVASSQVSSQASSSLISSSAASSSVFSSVGLSSSVASSSAANSSAISSSAASSSANSSSAASGLKCTFTVTNNWGSGYTANVMVSNTSPSAVTGWSALVTLPSGASLASAWNATTTGTNPVTAVNLGYNATIGAGGSTAFGMQINYTGSLVLPSCTAK